MLVRIGVRVSHLHIVREGQVRDAAPGQGGADRDVDHPGKLRGIVHDQVVVR